MEGVLNGNFSNLSKEEELEIAGGSLALALLYNFSYLMAVNPLCTTTAINCGFVTGIYIKNVTNTVTKKIESIIGGK